MTTISIMTNPMVTIRQWQDTPSRMEGIDEELERAMRIYGCQLIHAACVRLRLPAVCSGTAQVLLQRFYYRASLRQHGLLKMAMGAVFLAAKGEESPRRIRDVVNVFDYLTSSPDRATSSTTTVMAMFSREYYDAKNTVIQAEMELLRQLGFHVRVQHAHGLLLCYLRQLQPAASVDISPAGSVRRWKHVAWSALQDSYRLPVHVRYQPSTIACAAILYASSQVGGTLGTLFCNQPRVSDSALRPWWELLDARWEDLYGIVVELEKLYASPLPASKSPPPLTVAELDALLASQKIA